VGGGALVGPDTQVGGGVLVDPGTQVGGGTRAAPWWTLAELAIESFFPADEPTAELLGRLAEPLIGN